MPENKCYVDSAVSLVQASSLKEHSLHNTIWNGPLSEDFLASIKANGILSPVIIVKSKDPDLDRTVVCGRRRIKASTSFGVEMIPVRQWACDDPIEIRARIVEDNCRNEQSVAEKARVFQERSAQLHEKANRNRGKKIDPSERVDSPGEAAESVGMSKSTAARAVSVTKTADALIAAGKTEEAEKLIAVLNEGNVNKAAKLAKKMAAELERQAKKATQAASETEAEPEKTPQSESDQSAKESAMMDKSVLGLKAALKRVEAVRTEFVNASGRKRTVCDKFRSRYESIDGKMRVFSELMEKAEYQLGVLQHSWLLFRAEEDAK